MTDEEFQKNERFNDLSERLSGLNSTEKIEYLRNNFSEFNKEEIIEYLKNNFLDFNVKDIIELLRKEILKHNNLYYVKDNPIITDEEWDALYFELVRLETEYPMFYDSNSPTHKVGGEILTSFASVKHPFKLMSLDKISYDKIKLRKWLVDTYNTCLSFGIKTKFVLEKKFDGLTVINHYNETKLTQSVTRGNGIVGEDVTFNAQKINTIPKNISFNGKLGVHGEVYMPRKVFQHINQQLRENGEKEFSNCRNCAAGSLRQLDTSITAKRKLAFFSYQINYIEGIEFNTHVETLEFLREQGFSVSPDYQVFDFEQLDELIETCIGWANKRDTLSYDIDGMVIKVDNLKCRELLGNTAKYPKWAIAYKFPPVQAETKIESISMQVGRTGTINFVANLTPVLLSGSTVRHATLHNIDIISKKDIRVGDTVVIQKGGEIIPNILRVVLDKRTNDCIPYITPIHCPACGHSLVKEDAILRCENPSCRPQLIRNIAHFAEKDAMDIEDLGQKITEQLINSNLIRNVSDLYFIDKEQLLLLERFAEKKANNLLSAIEKSKNKGLSSLLYGIGIRNVGKETANILAANYKSIYNIFNASVSDISSIYGIGDVIAENVYHFFHDAEVINIIERLRQAGVVMVENQHEILSDILREKTFVITGTLSKPRNYFKDIIKNNGGKVTSSVSEKTDYILVGEDAGSKLDDANELVSKGKLQQNQIINEEQFNSLLI